MIIDGRAIANEIADTLTEKISRRSTSPVLCVVTAGLPNVSRGFLNVKKRFAERIGVAVEEQHFEADAHTQDIVTAIEKSVSLGNSGVIVQLPLPDHIDTAAVLDSIPVERDPDMLSDTSRRALQEGTSPVIPPVVGAFQEILRRNGVAISGKKVVVIGRGQLVGAPAVLWFETRGARVHVVDKNTDDIGAITRTADIIVSGAGVPGLVTPDMIAEGAVVLDAGTSETGGKTIGDVGPECAEKASIFTPVPGGVGPIAVAKLFENLLILTE